jgi:hypothetical protein
MGQCGISQPSAEQSERFAFPLCNFDGLAIEEILQECEMFGLDKFVVNEEPPDEFVFLESVRGGGRNETGFRQIAVNWIEREKFENNGISGGVQIAR